MSDDRTDDLTGDLTPDPFDEHLGARLHEAADGIDGAAVDRAGIALAVDRNRRRHARNRSLAVGVAAAIALLGGLAVATQTGGSGPEEVRSGQPTTVVDPCSAPTTTAPVPGSSSGAWFRLSDAQADALLEAGAIREDQAGPGTRHLVRLAREDLAVISDPPIGPYAQQQADLRAIDPAAIALLRERSMLTAAQETSIADSLMPELDEAQAELVFTELPDVTALPAGGGPLIFTSDPGAAAGGAGGQATSTSTTMAGADGGTPFDEWVAVLRSKGLMTPEQEAEVAAGRGFSLTSEQSAALQEHWDQQAAGTTTTALAFAPGGPSTTTEPDPCAPGPDGTTTSTP